MKNIFKTLFMASLVLATACNNSDDNTQATDGTFGAAEMYFDNGVNNNTLVLGASYSNSNDETLTIDRLNYIISNVVFIKANGTEYVYPKAESYFIVNAESNQTTLHFDHLPAGDYTKVRFGIGVDQQRYAQGESAQQDFWNTAVAQNMATTWNEGYRFINLEGTFTSAETAEATPFQIHQRTVDTFDNYREVTLELPTTARVREGETPNIHLIADANVILDGIHKILLSNHLNAEKTNATVSSGETLAEIAENTQKMFRVDHVHNGAGTHH